MDVKTISVDLGAFTGATMHPICFIPSTMGDITLLAAHIVGIGAGTSIGLILTQSTDIGTPAVAGTLAAFAGTIIYAEGVVFEATISDASVDTGTGDGIWLSVDQASGTCPATTNISISYAYGL